jgi:hypothetical protein
MERAGEVAKLLIDAVMMLLPIDYVLTPLPSCFWLPLSYSVSLIFVDAC